MSTGETSHTFIGGYQQNSDWKCLSVKEFLWTPLRFSKDNHICTVELHTYVVAQCVMCNLDTPYDEKQKGVCYLPLRYCLSHVPL